MKKLFTIAIASIIATLSVWAQNNHPGVDTKNWIVFQNDDSLTVSFDLTLTEDAVRKNQTLVIIPVIQSFSGEIEMPRIVVNGKNRARMDAREQAYMSVSDYVPADIYSTVTIGKKFSHVEISYSQSVELSQAIDNAGLFLEFYYFDCCNQNSFVSNNIIDEPLKVKPTRSARPVCGEVDNLCFLAAPKEAVKERSASLRAYINFHTARYTIIPTLGNNAVELNKIDQSIAHILEDSDMYRLQSISVDGYASPEGTWSSNKTLSGNRARTFWYYLSKKYSLQDFDGVKINAGGEDWNSLITMINEADDISNKDEILSIIDNTPDPDTRDRKIKLLNRGQTYRILLKDYYPKLRRMDMSLTYVVRGVNDEEAAILLETRPDDLSLEEFYGASKRKGLESDDYYKNAVKFFPHDAVAIINASSTWLNERDITNAWNLLIKVSDDPRAYNNFGVYYMLAKDYEQARRYFEMAVKEGNVNASKNLAVLDSYEAALKEYELSAGKHNYRIANQQ